MTRNGDGAELPQLPLLDAAAASSQVELKPSWRGWIHAGTFPVAIVAGVVLIVFAEGAPAKWASAVFMATSLLLFGNSALYHRFDWGPRTKAVLKRIDHANILLLIAAVVFLSFSLVKQLRKAQAAQDAGVYDEPAEKPQSPSA